MLTFPAFIHGENLFWFLVGVYGVAMSLWALVSYLLIKWWLDRKRRQRDQRDGEMRARESCDKLGP